MRGGNPLATAEHPAVFCKHGDFVVLLSSDGRPYSLCSFASGIVGLVSMSAWMSLLGHQETVMSLNYHSLFVCHKKHTRAHACSRSHLHIHTHACTHTQTLSISFYLLFCKYENYRPQVSAGDKSVKVVNQYRILTVLRHKHTDVTRESFCCQESKSSEQDVWEDWNQGTQTQTNCGQHQRNARKGMLRPNWMFFLKLTCCI